jgi:hypothetical protein
MQNVSNKQGTQLSLGASARKTGRALEENICKAWRPWRSQYNKVVINRFTHLFLDAGVPRFGRIWKAKRPVRPVQKGINKQGLHIYL